eukprot:PLAT11702.1.p2 GENE.PLAT11702.1~~PLAT11702.1.p2  ORF type:complete len:784 (-),score=403.45 PLAT11702.1:148-2499(-)
MAAEYGEWDFPAQEERDGIRFSWGEWPSARVTAARMVVPLGAMYQPLRHLPEMPPAVAYEPIVCKGATCGCVLNPFCQVDFRSKLWACPFCMQRNHFPPHYAENISETNLPAELIPQFTTLEYELPGPVARPPVFLLVVDTCLIEEELDDLKDSLQQSLMLLPEEALVGLITFGTTVQVHELGFADCPKAHVFRGSKGYAGRQVQELLGLAARGGGGGGGGKAGGKPMPAAAAAAAGGDATGSRFLLPLSECSFALETILEDLAKDPWPVPADRRPERATGTALNIAISLLEATHARSGARVMLFIGGPCTLGPGSVVSTKLMDVMRSHTDITKGEAPLVEPATEYYDALAARCAAASHVVDIFACSLDQVGLLEMRSLVERSGGLMVLADSFGQSVFKESFKRVFRRWPEGHPDAGQLQMGFAGQLQVLTSREVKVSGAIGHCTSLRTGGSGVAETEIGEGGTTAWSVGGLDPSSTICMYFEVVNAASTPMPPGKRRHMQFVTRYQHSNGRMRMRVTTVAGPWQTDPKSLASIGASFDQEAAAVIMARFAVKRAERDELSDIVRFLDRSLIRLCAKFAEYRKDTPSSFRLSPQFSIFPQFMFHLRRSQFLQIFNSSPDETAYYRSLLVKETVGNSLVMIQPALLSYGFSGPPTPVLLDIASIQPDRILLLDTFFHVVLFHGDTIATWREAKYQDMPEHENFRRLLQAPKDDAQMIMGDRFPVPRYITCDQGKSQARFLTAKVNPSSTHLTGPEAGGSGDVVLTDDVSLAVFMDHLTKLAVQS